MRQPEGWTPTVCDALCRQFDAESATGGAALDADAATHEIDVFLHDGQAQPGVNGVGVAGRIGPEETLEDPVTSVGGNPDPGVLDLDGQMTVVPGDAQVDRAVGAVVLDGVGEKIVEHLAELVGISLKYCGAIEVDAKVQAARLGK